MKQERGLETPRVSRTMSGRRSHGGCCEAEATHTLASPSLWEGSAGDLAPQVCCLQPLLSPTHEKLSLKHKDSQQSCTDLLRQQPMGKGQKPLLRGERMFRDGSWLRVCSMGGLHGFGHVSWVTSGPHKNLGPQKGNAKPRYHREAKNAGAAAEEISAMTPYASLLSGGGKYVTSPCWGLWCHPRLPHGWPW